MNAEVLQTAVKAVQIYAETHPRPSQVTQVQAAEMLNVSGSTVSRLVRTGRLKLNKSGMIPVTGNVNRALKLLSATFVVI